MALIAFAGPLQAEVRVTKRPVAFDVRSDHYRAVVDSDGCLTQFVVGSRPLLVSDVSISRGGYFFQAGVLGMDRVERQGDHRISGASSKAEVTYEFASDQVAVELRNRSSDPMVFFLVCATTFEAYRMGEQPLSATPASGDTASFSFFTGDHTLTVTGITKTWGPWEGPQHVVEIALPPGGEKTVHLAVRPTTADERTAITSLLAPPPAQPLVILSPQHYQVFQRSTADLGEVLISGRCNVEADRLEVRFAGPSDLLPEPHAISLQAPLREFHVRLPFPAGGWYSAEFQAVSGDKPLAQVDVARFGVGEVFVGAGQSNSTNCGQYQTKQTSDMVSAFEGHYWQLADDPQPGAADGSQGGSFWPAFGDAMYERYGVPIGVAVTGYGGTSVNQWQPEQGLFSGMMQRIHKLGPGGFRAVLWHQGESDIGMPADEYYAKLLNTINASRTEAGWQFPWFVAQASYHNVDKPRFDNVRGAQQRLWQHGHALEGPDTDTLTGDHRDFDGTGIHFSPKGLAAHGRMWATQVGAYLDSILPTTEVNAEPAETSPAP